MLKDPIGSKALAILRKAFECIGDKNLGFANSMLSLWFQFLVLSVPVQVNAAEQIVLGI